jgi:MIP family channel proteins
MDGTMRQALRGHWPEYLMEAAHLGLFMISACVFVTLLYHPGSPVGPTSPLGRSLGHEPLRRLLMGIAMASTAVAIIYSPWGRRSGAHFNPAVTLTFWRLGKVAGWDAAFYIAAQFLGGVTGVVVARAWLGAPVAHPAVHYAVTVPGSAGPLVALGAEIAISFVLMLVVLTVSNSRAAALTGLCSGLLVATYITLEAPLSGMSMNPARTLASAVPARTWTALWVYFTGPLIGMLVAADVYMLLARGREAVCAKLYHRPGTRCIFRCGYAERPAASAAVAEPRTSASVVGALWLLVLVAVATPAVVAQPAGGADTEAGRVREVGAIGLTVSDMERSVAFYRDLLGFEKTSDTEVAGPAYERLTGLAGLHARVVSMRLGAERIELTEFLTPHGRSAPADSRSNDVWFQHVAIITNDIEQGYLWLRRNNVRQVSPGPQRLPDWNPKAGGIKAFYFRDPDGHPLEILEFPPDKGAARWHRPSDRIFLGIDHTAIVVADTESSLRFYRDVLGLRIAGESENWGPEQERLNDVVGARLRITTLRAASGPGIELLEYLTPRTGRSAPTDPAVNDLVHWHTTVVPTDAAATATRLRAARAPFVSPGVVMLPDRALSFGAGFLARDPDGHALRVTGPEGVR